MNIEQVKCPLCGALGYEGSTCEYCGTLINVFHAHGGYAGDSIIRQQDDGFSPCPECGALGKIGSKCIYCGNHITASAASGIYKARLIPQRTISTEQFAKKVACYSHVGHFDEQSKCAKIVIGGNAGIINADGDVIVPCNYLNCYIDGYFAVLTWKKSGWIRPKAYLLNLEKGFFYKTDDINNWEFFVNEDVRNIFIKSQYDGEEIKVEIPEQDSSHTLLIGNCLKRFLNGNENDYLVNGVFPSIGIWEEFAGIDSLVIHNKRHLIMNNNRLGCIDIKWGYQESSCENLYFVYDMNEDNDGIGDIVNFVEFPQESIDAINNGTWETLLKQINKQLDKNPNSILWTIISILMAIGLIGISLFNAFY